LNKNITHPKPQSQDKPPILPLTESQLLGEVEDNNLLSLVKRWKRIYMIEKSKIIINYSRIKF
jgi:hypothetical protein